MEFVKQSNGDLVLWSGRNIVGRVIAPDKRTFDGRYIVRRRCECGLDEIWLTFPFRFDDEQSARIFVMKNWLSIRLYRTFTKRGHFRTA